MFLVNGGVTKVVFLGNGRVAKVMFRVNGGSEKSCVSGEWFNVGSGEWGNDRIESAVSEITGPNFRSMPWRHFSWDFPLMNA